MLRTASSLPLYRASDAGLRPGPFPGRAASPLPGLLAATRTGLPPAGDDELTNTKKHHGTTSRCHLPFCWAHEKRSLCLNPGSLNSVADHDLPSHSPAVAVQQASEACCGAGEIVRLSG